jgi:hypothetical protein
VPRRSLLTGALLTAGSVVGSFLLRRRAARRRERVDLYYEDGSMISLPEGSPESVRLLARAHELLRAARS